MTLGDYRKITDFNFLTVRENSNGELLEKIEKNVSECKHDSRIVAWATRNLFVKGNNGVVYLK